MASPIFAGTHSLRHPRERLAFFAVLLWALPIAGILGLIIHERVDFNKVALFIVIAMLYVTLARGRLIGSSVMIHEAQHPGVFAIVKRACAALEIPMPLVFVREDMLVPVAALGFGEPYSLVLSSHYIQQYNEDELAFVIGRQLGHIAAGHTRFLSLLSVNGNENPLIALIFGPWLRVCELTCDKVGLLVCGTLDAAARAIAISSFHHFGREVDIEQFAEQGREIASDSVLQWGEWLGAEPYATRRIAEMRAFMATHQFQVLEEWFLREANEPPPALPPAGTITVQRSDCAGWWRRFTATLIDLIVVVSVVAALTTTEEGPAKVQVQQTTKVVAGHTVKTIAVATPSPEPDTADGSTTIGWLRVGPGSIGIAQDKLPWQLRFLGRNVDYWAAAVYFTILVGLTGQTFGMMITGLRVVTVDFRKPNLLAALWRYVLGFALFIVILPLSIIQHRIMLHDRWSRTRLVTAERAMARAASARTAAAPA
ncbi:MAG TPA: RDD family protein [Candidatus Aquilonibacter sp.]|nr:RDD family protein [Candidatus Aquilonibacter sp.]